MKQPDWTEYLERFGEPQFERKPANLTHRMELVLPWPPSVNTYWRSVPGQGVKISAAGRAYRKTVKGLVLEQGNRRMRPGRLGMRITAYMPDRRRRDLDNILKAPLDALEHAGVYEDDGLIDTLHVHRARRQGESGIHVVIKLTGLEV